MKSSRLLVLFAGYAVLGGTSGWLHVRSADPAELHSSPAPSRRPARTAANLEGKWLAEGATRDEWLRRLNAVLKRPEDLGRIEDELEGATLDQALWNHVLGPAKSTRPDLPVPFPARSDGLLFQEEVKPAQAIRLLLGQTTGEPADRLLLIRILLTLATEPELSGIIDDLGKSAPAERQTILIYSAYLQWCRLAPEAAARDLLSRDLSGAFGNPDVLGLVIKSWTGKEPVSALKSIASSDFPSPIKTQLLSAALHDLPTTLNPNDYRQIFDRLFGEGASDSPVTGLSGRTLLLHFFLAAGTADPVAAESLVAGIADPNKQDIAREAIKTSQKK